MTVVKLLRPSPPQLRGWPLWQLRTSAIWFLLGTELAAVCLITGALQTAAPTADAVVRASVLFGLSVVYGEACDRIERLNRYLATDGLVSNQNSVVCFAGVLVLPLLPALVLVVAVYLHTYLRARRHHAAHPYRLTFTAAVTVIATVIASGAYHLLGGQLATVGVLGSLTVVVSLLLYTISNLVLLLICLGLVSQPASWRSLLPSHHQVTYENSTLLLGVVAGVMLLHTVWLSPTVLILVAVLHRASLVAELQHTARTDGKTGLLNFQAWQQLAQQHLIRSLRSKTSVAALLIDLDYFKQVNDDHGHLAGDVVLRTVADTIARELRDYDAVGRYGGEEFIALLPDVTTEAALAIAERIRHRIHTHHSNDLPHVTASIGIAITSCEQTLDLDQLIQTADTALYQAKAAGRNQVQLGVASHAAPGSASSRQPSG